MNIKFSLILLSFLIVQCTTAQTEQGMASYYSDKFQGSKTANGEKYDKNLLTAAHRTLPFGTMIKVINLKNGKSVVVKVNDRGPFVKGFIVDLSRKAAKQVDMELDGIVKVKLEVLGKSKPTSKNTPPKETPKPKLTSNYKPEPIKPVKKATPLLERSTHNLFKIQVHEQPKKEYGVQLGMYSKYENLLNHVSSLQSKWYKNVLVSLHTRSDGTSRYKVILGPFHNKETAESYMLDAKEKGLKGFVVDLSNL